VTPFAQDRQISIQRPALTRAESKGEAYRSAPAFFAKKPLRFTGINPQSRHIQKYFQLGPVFNV
jgi:hypothetical protein